MFLAVDQSIAVQFCTFYQIKLENGINIALTTFKKNTLMYEKVDSLVRVDNRIFRTRIERCFSNQGA